MIKKFGFILCLSTFSLLGQSLSEFAGSLPNPISDENSRILDQTGILENSGTKQRLNELIVRLEKETFVEMAIVILPSVDPLISKQVAVELFRIWGVGKKEKGNGILILHVLDQRRVEIEIGYGLEEKLTKVLCNRILKERAIPYFKLGAFSVGYESMFDSLAATLKSDLTPYSKVLSESSEKFPEPSKAALDEIPEGLETYLDPSYESRENWEQRYPLFLFGGIFIVIIGYFFLWERRGPWFKQYEKSHYRETRFTIWTSFFLIFSFVCFILSVVSFCYAKWGGDLLPQFIGIPSFAAFVLFFFTFNWFRKYWEDSLQYLPIPCKKCVSELCPVPYQEDREMYLDQNDIKEESLHSYKFIIFKCKSCYTIEKHRKADYRYGDYSICPNCKIRSVYERANIIHSSTYEREGEEQVRFKCVYCDYSDIKNRIVPKQIRPTPTSAFRSKFSSLNSFSGKSFSRRSSSAGGAGSSH
ncbi:TPM domain-containing protein [Leptospira ilyithenensis]|uniref:TPM domain-containing protein n=1 Tax=Leptospira ilyithenensis TaxID=2484901 RepID=A0A4V3JXE3_9LEPT|nr:TPM domain-containing protein [Leptospira ilyithenensis]TGN14499.1 hypothetical protein EHS11_00430 [Leptospira ilyithenensis]